MSRKVYVAWSGGLDSTWALYDLLRRDHVSVRAHHVRYILRQDRFEDDRNAYQVAKDRADAEDDAIDAMYAWFHDHGATFSLTRTLLDDGDYPSAGRGNFERMKFLLQVLDQAVGDGADERDLIVFGTNVKDHGRFGLYELKNMVAMAALVVPYIGAPKVTLAANSRMTREAMVEDLPPELTDMTMSCRRPRKVDGVWQPCGATWAFGTLDHWAETVKPCTCAEMVDLLSRYRDGWDSDRNTAADYPEE